MTQEFTDIDSYNANSYTYNTYTIDYNYASSVGLINDRFGGVSSDYDKGNIRYYGENPNNYIYFNCNNYNNQSDDTCEKWRIIGVFDDKVKIIRDSIGSYQMDNEYNNWTNSDLMYMLNNTYYNGGEPFDGTSNVNGLNISTQNKVAEVNWSKEELGYDSTGYEPSGAAEFYQTMSSNWWNGKIGLMYASDYLYGIKDWMTLADNWTLTNNDYYYGEYVWITMGEGLFTYAGNGYTDSSYETNPTLYLKSTETLKGGDGSFDNPYQLLQE